MNPTVVNSKLPNRESNTQLGYIFCFIADSMVYASVQPSQMAANHQKRAQKFKR